MSALQRLISRARVLDKLGGPNGYTPLSGLVADALAEYDRICNAAKFATQPTIIAIQECTPTHSIGVVVHMVAPARQTCKLCRDTLSVQEFRGPGYVPCPACTSPMPF